MALDLQPLRQTIYARKKASANLPWGSIPKRIIGSGKPRKTLERRNRNFRPPLLIKAGKIK